MSELIRKIKSGNFIVSIKYNRKSIKFLESNSQILNIKETDELVLNAVMKINRLDINIDLKKLKGQIKSTYRIRKGNIRIIFQYQRNEIHIAAIESIDFRGNIY